MSTQRIMPLWIASFCLLFVAQFFLISTSVFPEGDLSSMPLWVSQAIVVTNAKPILLGALPAGVVAFFVARLLRVVEGRTRAQSLSPKSILLTWLCFWVVSWLALYVWIGGPDPSTWSLALIGQPVGWVSFTLCALGLYLGSHRQREAKPYRDSSQEQEAEP
jgi:lysylphosphatidylglycerol synthetase-like protein (DUF2156 family)